MNELSRYKIIFINPETIKEKTQPCNRPAVTSIPPDSTISVSSETLDSYITSSIKTTTQWDSTTPEEPLATSTVYLDATSPVYSQTDHISEATGWITQTSQQSKTSYFTTHQNAVSTGMSRFSSGEESDPNTAGTNYSTSPILISMLNTTTGYSTLIATPDMQNAHYSTVHSRHGSTKTTSARTTGDSEPLNHTKRPNTPTTYPWHNHTIMTLSTATSNDSTSTRSLNTLTRIATETAAPFSSTSADERTKELGPTSPKHPKANSEATTLYTSTGYLLQTTPTTQFRSGGRPTVQVTPHDTTTVETTGLVRREGVPSTSSNTPLTEEIEHESEFANRTPKSVVSPKGPHYRTLTEIGTTSIKQRLLSAVITVEDTTVSAEHNAQQVTSREELSLRMVTTTKPSHPGKNRVK